MDISNQINSVLDGTDRKEKYKLHGLIYKQKRAVSKENAKIRAEKERTKEWAKYGATTLEEYIKAKQKCETKMEEDNQEKEQSVKKDGPQIENGYTKIANELLEALYKATASGLITGRERAFIDYVIRCTYGFHKTNGYFHNQEICKELGWKNYWTSFIVTSLVKKNIIIKDGDNLRLNKHYKEWKKLKRSKDIVKFHNNKPGEDIVNNHNDIVNNHNDIVNNHNDIVNNHNDNTSPNFSESNSPGSLNKSLKKSIKEINKESNSDSHKKLKIKKEIKQIEIPSWLDKEVWNDFIEHRKALKKPMTIQAIKLAFKKLEELKNQGYNPVDVINQSILNGWQGLFEPKKDKKEVYRKESPIV